MGKKWYQSKTIWFNVLAGAATLGAFFGFDITVEEQGAIAAGIFTVVNVFLRFTTKKAITK